MNVDLTVFVGEMASEYLDIKLNVNPIPGDEIHVPIEYADGESEHFLCTIDSRVHHLDEDGYASVMVFAHMEKDEVARLAKLQQSATAGNN